MYYVTMEEILVDSLHFLHASKYVVWIIIKLKYFIVFKIQCKFY